MPLFMHGCMKSMAIKQHLFWERPCFAWPRIFAARAHTSPFFEEPSTSVSGHRGRTGAALDLQATLAGSSDEHLGLMSAMSARPLTALGHNVTHRCLLSACRLEDDVGKLVLCSKDHPICSDVEQAWERECGRGRTPLRNQAVSRQKQTQYFVRVVKYKHTLQSLPTINQLLISTSY